MKTITYSVYLVDDKILPIKFIRSSNSRDVAESIMARCAEADFGETNYVVIDESDRKIITIAFNKQTEEAFGIQRGPEDTLF